MVQTTTIASSEGRNAARPGIRPGRVFVSGSASWRYRCPLLGPLERGHAEWPERDDRCPAGEARLPPMARGALAQRRRSCLVDARLGRLRPSSRRRFRRNLRSVYATSSRHLSPPWRRFRQGSRSRLRRRFRPVVDTLVQRHPARHGRA